jgi:hypothetical protein
VRRRRGGEGEGSFIDGWQMGRAVKAAGEGAKPEREPGGGRHTRTGRGTAETGRRSGAAEQPCNGRRFRPPAHRVIDYPLHHGTVSATQKTATLLPTPGLHKASSQSNAWCVTFTMNIHLDDLIVRLFRRRDWLGKATLNIQHTPLQSR